MPHHITAVSCYYLAHGTDGSVTVTTHHSITSIFWSLSLNSTIIYLISLGQFINLTFIKQFTATMTQSNVRITL